VSKLNLIKFIFLGFVCLVLALGGCVTTTNIKTATKLSQLGRDSSIVFGQIEWLEDGKEKELGEGFFTIAVTPHLMNMEDNTRIMGEVSEEGRFFWSLEEGTYLIHKISYRDPWSGEYFFVPKMVFNVPENGEVYYIGILRSEFEPDRDLIGGLSGSRVKFTIQDEFDRDSSDFQERLSIPSKIIEKSLMIYDSRLPRTVETTKEFNQAISIMNAILYGISQ